ncbi:Putative efflux system component YknX [Vibrio aerogenes CECT 7868]|uniref:Putative efflux system component YknX n=1 Tax=Vibrio aerogenes CECT 7868 TaxID=1216006 RepID=A0A1M5V645_9VIBR|nr:HlyD family efflux transporter periplasmic adaptor subunit [Vibrio aerogenes]SHH70747.1 Putative efflux system component YknX [Vibrio aerogenes CECT 7868]
MDKPRVRKQPILRQRNLIIAIVILVTGVLGTSAVTFRPSEYTLSRERIQIAQVRRGNMTVEVRGNGIFAPKSIRWISAYADGRVENVAVKAGTRVKAGDVIARLSNPDLEQHAQETSWALQAAKAAHQALKMKQQSQLLDAKARMLQTRHQLEKISLKYRAQNQLLRQNNGAVSRIDYDQTRLDRAQFQEQLTIEQQRVEKLKLTQQAELSADKASVNQLQNALERAQTRFNALTITAQQDGIIQAVNIEAGQQIPRGFNVARLAQPKDLIAELKIPERQIRQVMTGQTATINTHEHQIQGTVIRIDPSVSQGTVQVDVALTDTLPPEARPDLSIEGTILVSALQNIRYVTRPALAQSHSPGTVFRLSADGKTAVRVPVVYGKGSADNIEIKKGLKVNDRIITSNQQAWAHTDTVRLIDEH